MNKRIQKVFTLVISLVVVSLIATTAAFAYVPYTAYNYDYYGEIVNGPAGYVPDEVLVGSDCGIDKFVNPSDMLVSNDNKIYIVDSGAANSASRVIILNENFKLIKMIDTFVYNGEKLTVLNATGLALDKNGNIYLCDPDGFRILKLDTTGKVSQIFGAPPSNYVADNFVYRPQKVDIAIDGSLYVISKGCTDGILEFNSSGSFVRFFGAPEVELSATDYINIYWRNIYRVFGGDSVDQYFATYVPSEFSNLTVDSNGFVYTMVAANEDSTDEVYKINFVGANVLDPTLKSAGKQTASLSANYGDLITRSTAGASNVFADICLDENGFFSLLDSNLGRVFEYDKEGNLIFVYGNKGNQINQIQEGLLCSPTAIAKINNKTLVIDAETGAITIFALSDYGEEFHTAVIYYNEGKYDLAEGPWSNVLKYDANSELAHIGLGKVYYMNGEYKEALAEFKLGNDRYNYSRTFKLYRDEVIRSHFDWIAIVVILLLVVVVVSKKYGKKIKRWIKSKKGGEQQ